MPPYDPKANRRNATPDGDPAPVDGLLGPAPDVEAPDVSEVSDVSEAPETVAAPEPTVDLTETAPEPETAPAPETPPEPEPRPYLSLVSEPAAPRVVPDPPSGRRGDPRVLVALAVGAAATVAVGIAVVLRRRG